MCHGEAGKASNGGLVAQSDASQRQPPRWRDIVHGTRHRPGHDPGSGEHRSADQMCKGDKSVRHAGCHVTPGCWGGGWAQATVREGGVGGEGLQYRVPFL